MKKNHAETLSGLPREGHENWPTIFIKGACIRHLRVKTSSLLPGHADGMLDSFIENEGSRREG